MDLTRGSEFQTVFKKIPSSVPRQSSSGRGRSHMGFDAAVYGVGQGFGGFLDLCEKVFFLIQYSGAILPPQVKFFLS
jgi:hypothetical protein